LDTNISLNGAYSVVVYATDLNGNMNHTFQKLISFNPSINMAGEHGNLDYNDMPIDINSLELGILNNSGYLCNYSVETNPNICSKSGNLSENESIITQVSDLSYETAYNWKISIDQGFLIYNLTFTFITTDAPEDTSNTGGSSGESGGFMPPSLPDEPEGETNLPPETPVSPQGSCKVEIGKIQTYTVSSWDKNRDNIRFQMDWGKGLISDWSDFVSSNESVIFTHIFTVGSEFNLTVRTQDEYGLNSSWSDPFTVYVSNINDTTKEKYGIEILTNLNNETGEISFSHDFLNSSLENISIMWDFGDGFISEGISPKHQYIEPGEYIVTVTITNKDGNVTTNTFTVSIPEPQQQLDTKIMESEESTQSMPWIMLLVGIIASIAGVFVVLKFQGH